MITLNKLFKLNETIWRKCKLYFTILKCVFLKSNFVFLLVGADVVLCVFANFATFFDTSTEIEKFEKTNKRHQRRQKNENEP